MQLSGDVGGGGGAMERPTCLLQLGSPVLEPDFDLRLVQVELRGEALPALVRQVAADVELDEQASKLDAMERRPGPTRPSPLSVVGAR